MSVEANKKFATCCAEAGGLLATRVELCNYNWLTSNIDEGFTLKSLLGDKATAHSYARCLIGSGVDASACCMGIKPDEHKTGTLPKLASTKCPLNRLCAGLDVSNDEAVTQWVANFDHDCDHRTKVEIAECLGGTKSGGAGDYTTWLIVGVIVAVICAILAVGLAVYCCCCKRKPGGASLNELTKKREILHQECIKQTEHLKTIYLIPLLTDGRRLTPTRLGREEKVLLGGLRGRVTTKRQLESRVRAIDKEMGALRARLRQVERGDTVGRLGIQVELAEKDAEASFTFAKVCETNVAIRQTENRLWQRGIRISYTKDTANRYASARAGDPGLRQLIEAYAQLAVLFGQKRELELEMAKRIRQRLADASKKGKGRGR